MKLYISIHYQQYLIFLSNLNLLYFLRSIYENYNKVLILFYIQSRFIQAIFSIFQIIPEKQKLNPIKYFLYLFYFHQLLMDQIHPNKDQDHQARDLVHQNFLSSIFLQVLFLKHSNLIFYFFSYFFTLFIFSQEIFFFLTILYFHYLNAFIILNFLTSQNYCLNLYQLLHDIIFLPLFNQPLFFLIHHFQVL